MGKNKLKKFAEMETFSCVFQYPYAVLQSKGFPMRGRWNEEFFHNNHPIVLELGCGKGEYTVGLGRRDADKNFIGVDIKGARIWKGAKIATEEQLNNVAFLRTDIELLSNFFAKGEVSEIWITFPDPQMQKTRKRLLSPRFLKLYSEFLVDGGSIHLKTDSPFLYKYADRLVAANHLPVNINTSDLYGSGLADEKSSIKTFYEQQWLSRGKSIKLLSLRLPADAIIEDVDESDIERDDYHSFQRGVMQCMPDQI